MITDDLLAEPAFKKNDELFIASLNEAIEIHRAGNQFFDFVCQKKGFEKVQSIQDLNTMPFLMVNLFKFHELITGKKENIVLTLGSSGTSGQRSQIFLDETSLRRVKNLAYNVYRDLGIT